LELRSIRVAVNAVNAANTPDKAAVDRPLTSCGPSSDPARMPGASFQKIGQTTASCAWCVRTLEIEVKTIVASDVATAMCRMCSGGKCW
jgi:hypothetical protein